MMPQPPGFKPPVNNRIPKDVPARASAKPLQNAVIGTAKDDVKLTEDETSFILRTTLLPEHATDPNVLRFISNYLICRDARQAAKEAGLTGNDGVNLRRRPDIFDAIRLLTEKAVMKYGYDASEVVEKVKEIAFVDPIEFERADGTYKKLKDMSPEVRRAIKKIKVKNLYDTDPNGMKIVIGEIIEIELWDKMKAAELLGREKDIFKETKVHQHDVTKNMSDILLESRKRAESRLREVGERLSLGSSGGAAVDATVVEDGE